MLFRSAADHRLDKAVVGQLAVLVQPHQAGEGQPQFPFVQAADAVGQGLGQHGHHLVGVVHAGRPAEGLIVGLGAGAHIVGHICNVDPFGLVTLCLIFSNTIPKF